jgi:hypothetical protein
MKEVYDMKSVRVISFHILIYFQADSGIDIITDYISRLLHSLLAHVDDQIVKVCIVPILVEIMFDIGA